MQVNQQLQNTAAIASQSQTELLNQIANQITI